MTSTLPPSRWVSLERAAAEVSISRATVCRLIQRGHIVSAKIGTRRLVDLDSLDCHIQRCRQDLADLGKSGELGLPLSSA